MDGFETEPRDSEKKPWENMPPEMEKSFEERNEALIRRMNGRRATMLIVSALTAVAALILIFFPHSPFSLCLSLPGLLAGIGADAASEAGNIWLRVLGAALSVLFAGICAGLWLLSKKYTAPIAVYPALILGDLLAMIAFFDRFGIDYLFISTAFHIWALFSSVQLLKDRTELNRLWRAESGSRSAWIATPLKPRGKSLDETGRFRKK